MYTVYLLLNIRLV